MDFRYTVWGPQGLIGTMMKHDHLEELIADFEPRFNVNATVNKAHEVRALKAGQLNIVVIQPDPSLLRRERGKLKLVKKSPKVTEENNAISETVTKATRPAPPTIGGYVTGSF